MSEFFHYFYASIAPCGTIDCVHIQIRGWMGRYGGDWRRVRFIHFLSERLLIALKAFDLLHIHGSQPAAHGRGVGVMRLQYGIPMNVSAKPFNKHD